MKAAFYFILLVLFYNLSSCSKQDDCDNPVDCLPEMTQIGANTAGCLVNGKVLIPEGQSLNSGSVLKAQYNNRNEDYLFSLAISDLKGEERFIFISMRGVKLIQNETYFLKKNTTGLYGAYLTEDLTAYSTDSETIGEVFISNLDENKNIISGTFWFDGRNNQGELIEVRQGRFDVKY